LALFVFVSADQNPWSTNILKRTLTHTIACAAFIASGYTNAGAIIGGSLTEGDANQLESWLGVGDQDFTSIFTGQAGVATAAEFHAAVDGKGPTFSIYNITHEILGDMLIGGYTQVDWGSNTGYNPDSSAFIFNLTSGEMQKIQQIYEHVSVYVNEIYFPTFGGGHDLYGGKTILGTCSGNSFYNSYTSCSGYSFSLGYGQSQGQITVSNDSGHGDGDSGISYYQWYINSLEVYTIADAQVTEPATLGLLGLGLAALGFRRKK
jgi:hypothetical protein